MKWKLLLAGLCGWGGVTIAQDRIVTVTGDTLNGTVIEQKDGWIRIRCKDKEKTLRLSRDQLAGWDKNYYRQKSVRPSKRPEYTVRRNPREKIYIESLVSAPLYAPSSFYWEVNAGWGYRTASISPDITGGLYDFLKKMKSGFQLNTSLIWFFNEYVGVGGGYTLFASSHMGRQVYIDTESSVPELSDRLYLHYIGPEIVCRFRHHEGKNAFLAFWQLGYGAYREKMEMMETAVKMQGGTFILNIAVGYDFGLSRHTALGCKIHWTAGALRRCTINGERMELRGDAKENISTIGISLGFRFRS